MKNNLINNNSLTQRLIQIIRKQAKHNNYSVLEQIDRSIDWEEIVAPISESIRYSLTGRFKSYDLTLIIKCFILQNIYELSNSELYDEIRDRNSFQRFLGIREFPQIPSEEILSYYRELLLAKGVYNELLNLFCDQLLESKFQLSQKTEFFSEFAGEEKELISDLETIHINDKEYSNGNIEKKILQIEERIQNIFEEKFPESDKLKFGIEEKEETVTGKLKNLKDEIKFLEKKVQEPDEKTLQIYSNLLKIYEKLQNIDSSGKEKISTFKKHRPDTDGGKSKIISILSDIEERLKMLEEVTEEKSIAYDIPEHKLKEKKMDSGTEELLSKLESINEKLNEVAKEKKDEAVDKETEKKDKESKEALYKKLFDSFYNQLVDANIVDQETPAEEKIIRKEQVIKQVQAEEIPVKPEITVEKSRTEELENKLKKLEDDYEKLLNKLTEKEKLSEKEEKLRKLEDEIRSMYETKITETPVKIQETEPKKQIIVEEPETVIKKTVPKYDEETGVITPQKEEAKVKRPIKEINLRKKRKVYVFNDSNLTEDYEFGLRFYKLGFKTMFVNMKIEEGDQYSIVATGEYFPNTFWGSVKQRSRWIAGITLQNWKIHKWKGSLKTKYFLMRDRKSLFNFVGLFLANIVFAYFVYNLISMTFGLTPVIPLVEKSSLLWYLMVISFFFMILRLVHRFAFTYNWYGFRYAIASFVRLLFDNIINFFATLRAFSVYNKNKVKVTWDATDHY